jgi:hypothetical protein
MRTGRHSGPEKPARRYALTGAIWLVVAVCAVVVIVAGEALHRYALGEAGMAALALSLGLAIGQLARARNIRRISRQVRDDLLAVDTARPSVVVRRNGGLIGRLRRLAYSTGLARPRQR